MVAIAFFFTISVFLEWIFMDKSKRQKKRLLLMISVAAVLCLISEVLYVCKDNWVLAMPMKQMLSPFVSWLVPLK